MSTIDKLRIRLIAVLEKHKGGPFEAALEELRGLRWDGGAIEVGCDYRTQPYLDHTIVDLGDGPQGSNVVAVVSGADPEGGKWRRFTLSRKSAGHYELDVFPTPFRNEIDPLSPGIPPGASRPR